MAYYIPFLPFNELTGWCQVKDGNPAGWVLFQRHYSRYKYADGRKPSLFVGPGEKEVLITPDGKALFVWRKFLSMNGQRGINCAVFRNEGPVLSSELINQVEKIAWHRWPGERLYTYVNPEKVMSKNPGFCFKKSGWTFCGKTGKGLLIYEKLPA